MGDHTELLPASAGVEGQELPAFWPILAAAGKLAPFSLGTTS